MATNDKYDRQLRLWGAEGQKALAETCVVLVNTTAAGTETLKNLVLPGVGAFLIVDDQKAVDGDFASNFFVVQDASKSRSQIACELLRELNPDVVGNYKSVPSLMEANWHSILTTTGKAKVLVVASELEPIVLETVAGACQSARLPCIAIYSYGLIGIVRLQAPPLPILNPKPRDARPDLRLVHPFPVLASLADSIDWDNLQSHEHGHIPYPLILLRIAKEWKDTHDGSLPSTFIEKQEFQLMIPKASRDFDAEENFREAQKHSYLAYAPRELDLDHLVSLRDASQNASPILYACLQGLDAFLQRHPLQPPLQGTIPDMTSSSALYVQLQKIYKEQADFDFQEMRTLVNPTIVSDSTLHDFCRNVFSLDLIPIRSIRDEYYNSPSNEITDELTMATMEGDERPEQLPLLWYLAFRACQAFHGEYGRYPGTVEDYALDVPKLQTFLYKVVQHYRLTEVELVRTQLIENISVATEMTRYANAEIHNVASVIGGVASQEAVKIITGQYVPLNNTYVYNGIASVGGVYKF
jgi:amyloid beta precursor protein binding protein 1